MACMLCQKSDNELFDVYTCYGDGYRSVRNDLIELYGIHADSYLSASYCVCNMCMNIIDNLAKFKRRLWSLIRHANKGCKERKLAKIWYFLASLKFEDEYDNDDADDDSASYRAATPCTPCRTPTPSSLMTVKHSKVYDTSLEEKIADMEHRRSLSAVSSGFGPSNLSESSEVVRLTSRGRRRNTNTSPLSESSFTSYYNMDTRKRRKAGNYDEHGRLIRKRTRSVSRAQEQENRAFQTTKYYCKDVGCPLYFEDIDVLNHHKILHHNTLALYYCQECNRKYTTLELFNVHKKNHDVLPFLCPLCQCEIENQAALQKHLGEHAIYSVWCKYCDRSFLDKKTRDAHSKKAHSGSRERVVYQRRILLDQFISIDYEFPTGKSKKTKYVERARHNRTETPLDVTAENLKLMNIEFLTAAPRPVCQTDQPLPDSHLSSANNGDSELIEAGCS